MPLYIVSRWSGDPKLDPNAAQAMTWVQTRDLRNFEMPPADVVLVDRLMERDAA
jgi:8-oxo-dGTP diphosphatase